MCGLHKKIFTFYGNHPSARAITTSPDRFVLTKGGFRRRVCRLPPSPGCRCERISSAAMDSPIPKELSKQLRRYMTTPTCQELPIKVMRSFSFLGALPDTGSCVATREAHQHFTLLHRWNPPLTCIANHPVGVSVSVLQARRFSPWDGTRPRSCKSGELLPCQVPTWF